MKTMTGDNNISLRLWGFIDFNQLDFVFVLFFFSASFFRSMSKPTGFFRCSTKSFSYSLFSSSNFRMFLFFCCWSTFFCGFEIFDARTTNNNEKKRNQRIDDACDFHSKTIFSLTLFFFHFGLFSVGCQRHS